MRLLLLLASMFLPLAPAAAQPVREVPVGQHIDWSREAHPRPVTFRSGPFSLTFTSRAEGEDHFEPVLRIEAAGAAPVELSGAPTPPHSEHRATVGEIGGRPFLLFQSYSGGAHCCTAITLVELQGGRLRAVNVGGDWNGGYMDDLPTDLDGDGALDFVMSDNSFLYAFVSYAESSSPPQIISIIDGQATDVSARPAFRAVFERGLEDERRFCIDPENEMSPNGACAAYVARAARLGRFDEAWALMLREHAPNMPWPYTAGCRVPAAEGQCPENQQIRHENFPDALRAHLVSAGYIDR